jgi:hypothetical protein
MAAPPLEWRPSKVAFLTQTLPDAAVNECGPPKAFARKSLPFQDAQFSSTRMNDQQQPVEWRSVTVTDQAFMECPRAIGWLTT